MHKLFRTLVFPLLLALFTGVVAGAEVIRVGSDMTYAPFEYIDEKTKQPTGFDIEYMQALGKVMGVEIEFVNTAWDGIIPGLLANQYDLLISAMTITPERLQAIDFSDPYFSTGQVIVVRKGTTNIKTPNDLRGKIVTVQIGTTGQFAAEKIPGIRRIDTYNTMPEAFTALKWGRADASVADELVALEEIRANPDALVVVGEPFTTENYGIGIKKGRTDLKNRVNAAIAELKRNGTYDQLYRKWISGL
jgi:polar amino acid transport system substrate-binding protein